MNEGAQLQAGAPLTAQDFSSMAPFMVPSSFDRLRMAMMQQPQQQQATPLPAYGGIMGFGG